MFIKNFNLICYPLDMRNFKFQQTLQVTGTLNAYRINFLSL